MSHLPKSVRMELSGSDNHGGIFARLSRFALCIAPSSNHAYDALEAVSRTIPNPTDADLRDAFRDLLAHLDELGDDVSSMMGLPPSSIVARFSFLPYHQRVSFALVVIEEFSIADAAEIMGLAEEDVRVLLHATRDFLFTARWTTRPDA